MATETCEIKYTGHFTAFGAGQGTIIAQAVGPQGTYITASRRNFKIKRGSTAEQSAAAQAELNSVINELVADGWQPVPGGAINRWLPLRPQLYARDVTPTE